MLIFDVCLELDIQDSVEHPFRWQDTTGWQLIRITSGHFQKVFQLADIVSPLQLHTRGQVLGSKMKIIRHAGMHGLVEVVWKYLTVVRLVLTGGIHLVSQTGILP
jgi:hypothetical protein